MLETGVGEKSFALSRFASSLESREGGKEGGREGGRNEDRKRMP